MKYLEMKREKYCTVSLIYEKIMKMTNIEEFNTAFIEVFGVTREVLNESFSKENIEGWDSVHQLNIISILEESFDVMFEPEEIMELTSYEKGIEILNRYGIDLKP